MDCISKAFFFGSFLFLLVNLYTNWCRRKTSKCYRWGERVCTVRQDSLYIVRIESVVTNLDSLFNGQLLQ